MLPRRRQRVTQLGSFDEMQSLLRSAETKQSYTGKFNYEIFAHLVQKRDLPCNFKKY